MKNDQIISNYASCVIEHPLVSQSVKSLDLYMRFLEESFMESRKGNSMVFIANIVICTS